MLRELRDVQLFIEGIQVPLIHASCQQPVNSFNTCSFSVPATPAGLKIRYRSHVLIFVSRPAMEDQELKYDLIFDGEIASSGFSYSPSSTSCQFTAVGHYHHLSQRLMMMGKNPLIDQNNSGTDDIYVGAGVSTYAPMGAINDTFFQASKGSAGDMDMTEGLKKYLQGLYDNSDANVENTTASSNLGKKGVDTFYRDIGEKRKLRLDLGKERYFFSKSETMNKLLGFKAGEATNLLYQQMGSELTGMMTRWDIIQRLLNLFTYDATMPLGTIKNSFIAKPNLYFNAPPKCNVILPNMLTGVSFSDDFRSKKSRCFSKLTGMPGILGSNIYNNWTPFEVNQNIRDIYAVKTKEQIAAEATQAAENYANAEIAWRKTSAGTQENANARANADAAKVAYEKAKKADISESIYGAGATTRLFETKWETKYGIHAGFTTVYSPYVLCASAALSKEKADATAQSKDTYLSMQKVIQEYERMKVFYGTSQLSFTCHYNPNLVAGFPILIIQAYSATSKETGGATEYIAFVGYLTHVTHSLTPQGGFGTSGSVGFVRVINSSIDMLNDESLNVKDNGLPWMTQPLTDMKSTAPAAAAAKKALSNEYLPDKIGDTLYKELFGCDPAYTITDVEKAASEIYDKYFTALTDTDNDQKLDEFIKTNIIAERQFASKNEVLEYYGFKEKEGAEPSVVPEAVSTDPERKAVVEEYISSLGFDPSTEALGFGVSKILGK